jgi:hypothetical protein
MPGADHGLVVSRADGNVRPITYLVMEDPFPSVVAPRERLPRSTGMSSPFTMHE